VHQFVDAFGNVDIPVAVIGIGVNPVDEAVGFKQDRISLSVLGRQQPLTSEQIAGLRQYAKSFFS